MPVIKWIERISLCAQMRFYWFFAFYYFWRYFLFFWIFQTFLSFFRFLCVSADNSVFYQIFLRLSSDFTAFFWFLYFLPLFTFSLTPVFPALSIEMSIISKCDRSLMTESIFSIFTFIQLFPWCRWMRVFN